MCTAAVVAVVAEAARVVPGARAAPEARAAELAGQVMVPLPPTE
jgi:hypothetical protein